MAEISNKKLIVEVCNAKNLMSKDGQGTASANAIVDFDGQRRRTKTIFRDLNPRWDEELEFLVHDDAESLAAETLELNLYNDKKTIGKRSTFLGKVKINGTSFSTSEPTDLDWLEEDQITPLPEEHKLSEAAPPPPSVAAAEEEKQPEGVDDFPRGWNFFLPIFMFYARRRKVLVTYYQKSTRVL